MRKRKFGRLILLTATAWLVASCGTSRAFLPAEGCSALAEPILNRDTPHAVIGDSGDTLLDWQLYGAAETGQVTVANQDKRDGFGIIKRCEERDAASVRRINAPWWRFGF